MKKKFLLGMAAGLFAVATVLSFNVSSANGASDVSLDDIAMMAQAQNENTNSDNKKDEEKTKGAYVYKPTNNDCYTSDNKKGKWQDCMYESDAPAWAAECMAGRCL